MASAPGMISHCLFAYMWKAKVDWSSQALLWARFGATWTQSAFTYRITFNIIFRFKLGSTWSLELQFFYAVIISVMNRPTLRTAHIVSEYVIIVHHHNNRIHLQGLGIMARSDPRISRTGPSISSVVSSSPFFLLGNKGIPSVGIVKTCS